MRCFAFGLAVGLVAMAPVSWCAEGPPAIVALTLDTSGSIRSDLIEQTRVLAVSILEALPAGSEVALFVFDDTPRLLLERTRDPEAVRQALKSVERAGRYTALYDALYDASRYLDRGPRSRKAIVLITDGKDENSVLQQEDGLRVAVAGRIPVFAVGVGRVEEAVLARIAKLTGGEFARMSEAKGEAIAARIATLEPSGASAPPTRAPIRPRPPARRPPEGPPASLVILIVGSSLTVLAAGVALALRTRPVTGSNPQAAVEPLVGLGSDDDEAGRTILSKTPDVDLADRTVVLKTGPALRVDNGPAAGRVFRLEPGRVVAIGRAPGNDLEIADPSISAEHALVKWEDGGYVIYDAQSTNGTVVNGQTVERQPLREGDVITLGAVRITVAPE